MTASILLFSTTALLLSYVNRTFSIDAWVASAYRAMIGLAVVFAMQKSTGKLDLRRIFTQPLLLARGLLGGATIPVYYITIMELGPGRAGMIAGSYPLFAATFGMLFLREPVSRKYYTYITLALIGLAGVFSSNGLESAKPLYDILALIGAAVGGICVVLIRHLRHTETTSNIFAAQCVFTLAIGLVATQGNLLIANPQALGLVLLAAFTVVGAQLTLTEAFRHINIAKGSTLQMLTPALTALGSACLLGESFSHLEILGGCAIIFASYKIVTDKAKA